MPKGKVKYTAKQDRQAEHIAKGYEKKGISAKKAKGIGYATVNSSGSRKGKGKQH